MLPCFDGQSSVARSFASAVADVLLSEGGTALADGVAMRPGGRGRDDVVERRKGAVSAGSWFVRGDNAIRMGSGVCTGGKVPWNAVWEPNTRVVAVARRAAGVGGCRRRRRGRRDGEVEIIHTVQTAEVRLYTDGGSGGRARWWLKCPGRCEGTGRRDPSGLQNKAGTLDERGQCLAAVL